MFGNNAVIGNTGAWLIAAIVESRTQFREADCLVSRSRAGAVCGVGGVGISANNVRVTSANLAFNDATAWYFTPGPNTVAQIVGDSPDPSTPGQTYAVQVSVTEGAGISITGEPRGTVEVSDGLGGVCTITLAETVGEIGSCNLNTAATGTATLTARYLGFGGWDSSGATATHTVGAGGVIFLNGFE